MENENGNSQVQSVANPPTAAGPTSAELQAKIQELEKQSEGRLRDLQNERAKRQELESKVVPPVAQQDVTQDELGKVLSPYIAPVIKRAERAEAFMANALRDKALEHLSVKTGKSKEAVINDKELDNKLSDIVKRFRLQGDVYDITIRACEIMELENIKAKEVERQRTVSASTTASLPTGTVPPPSVGSKEFSEEDFNALPMHEYEKLSSSGGFHQNKEGKIVFTPK